MLDGVPAGSRILDLGCGSGRPIAEYVARRGHHVTGVDQSAALLARARARLPHCDWMACRLEDFAFRGSFAAAVCWDSLFHVERAHHAPILAGVARSLLPGGRLMLTVGGADHPPFTDTMFDRRFFYDSQPPDGALTLLDGLGFALVVHAFTERPMDGRDRGRYAIVAEKSRPAPTDPASE